MARTDGTPPNHLIQRLATEPHAFHFYRAVRLLQAHFAETPRFGRSSSPKDDPIRFGQRPSLAFAPSTIDSLETADPDRPPRLFVNFLGLLGPNGPLPLCLTEFARERTLNARDPTLTAFLDMFHHRIICLFIRAWAESQKALDLDRPTRSRYQRYIGSLFGLGVETLWQRDALPDHAKLFYSGRLSLQSRNAEGLEAIVQDFFGIPTEVQPFVGRWLDLPADSHCQLGDSPRTGSLGVSLIAGTQFWDCQMTFGIKLGPMTLADYERLLPDGDSFQRLKCWILNYVGHEYFWRVQLVLKANQVPAIQLGQAGKLGYSTWLKTKEFTQDAADLVVLGG